MRFVILFIFNFLLLSQIVNSQNASILDSIVLTYPERFSHPKDLANLILRDFHADEEKALAIYTWIVNNIAYDRSVYNKFIYHYGSEEERLKKEERYKYKLSKYVISRGVGVCKSYSVLFEVLCDLTNLNSRIVIGCSKTKIGRIGGKCYSDHAWNIVEINEKEYLVDATWGAGGFFENEFVREVNYGYFMTDPDIFIKNHYPDDYDNSLLNYEYDKDLFLNSPLIFNSFNKDYELIHPIDGVLMEKEIQFRIETTNQISSISYTLGKQQYYVDNYLHNDDVLTFTIDITNLKSRELLVFINENPLFGFKLK